MFFAVADLFFQNQTFRKNSLRNTMKVSNSLDPDQNVRPDLGPNALQKLTADDVSRSKAKIFNLHAVTPKGQAKN